MSSLILPGTPLFESTLHSTLPPGWDQNVSCDFANAFAVRHESGLLEAMTVQELNDYLYGGEYDELEDDEFSDSDD